MSEKDIGTEPVDELPSTGDVTVIKGSSVVPSAEDFLHPLEKKASEHKKNETVDSVLDQFIEQKFIPNYYTSILNL